MDWIKTQSGLNLCQTGILTKFCAKYFEYTKQIMYKAVTPEFCGTL